MTVALLFALSASAVAAVAYAFLDFSAVTALIMGAVLGATSPAICLPVASGLSVRNDVKTVVELESAIGEVLVIVTVALLIESATTGATSAWAWAHGFTVSLLVALAVSSIAGVSTPSRSSPFRTCT